MSPFNRAAFFTGIVAILTLSFISATAQPKRVDWKLFSKNLVNAIHTDNQGLKCSAMCLMIEHADSLDVKDAQFEIVRIFRNHENRRMRELAMMTLYNLKYGFGMFIIERSARFEHDPYIRKRCCCLMSYYLQNGREG